MYKEKIRDTIRTLRKHERNKKKWKSLAKKEIGYWNQYLEKYYKKAIIHTQLNDVSQKTSKYKEYRRKYEADYRNKYRVLHNYKSIKSIYKKKFGKKFQSHLDKYCEERKFN